MGSWSRDHHHKLIMPSTPVLSKLNRDSHLIKKSSPPPANHRQYHRHSPPTVIYTHSPKVIHTKPRDFMALVQKLTGSTNPTKNQNPKSLPAGPSPPPPPPLSPPPANLPMYYDFEEFETKNVISLNNNNNKNSSLMGLFDMEDTPSSSIRAEENLKTGGSPLKYFAPPIFDPTVVSTNSLPFFAPSYGDFCCINKNNNNNNIHNNNNIGMAAMINENSAPIYNQNNTDATRRDSGTASLYNDGVYMNGMCLIPPWRSPSSIEEAYVNEFTHFS